MWYNEPKESFSPGYDSSEDIIISEDLSDTQTKQSNNNTDNKLDMNQILQMFGVKEDKLQEVANLADKWQDALLNLTNDNSNNEDDIAPIIKYLSQVLPEFGFEKNTDNKDNTDTNDNNTEEAKTFTFNFPLSTWCTDSDIIKQVTHQNKDTNIKDTNIRELMDKNWQNIFIEQVCDGKINTASLTYIRRDYNKLRNIEKLAFLHSIQKDIREATHKEFSIEYQDKINRLEEDNCLLNDKNDELSIQLVQTRRQLQKYE